MCPAQVVLLNGPLLPSRKKIPDIFPGGSSFGNPAPWEPGYPCLLGFIQIVADEHHVKSKKNRKFNPLSHGSTWHKSVCFRVAIASPVPEFPGFKANSKSLLASASNWRYGHWPWRPRLYPQVARYLEEPPDEFDRLFNGCKWWIIIYNIYIIIWYNMCSLMWKMRNTPWGTTWRYHWFWAVESEEGSSLAQNGMDVTCIGTRSVDKSW
jgi:hypothetical protein